MAKFKGNPIFPSMVDNFLDRCAMRAIMEDVNAKDVSGHGQITRHVIGTDVHEAMEKALGFLKTQKEKGKFTPNDNLIKELLTRAENEAKASLKYKTSRAQFGHIKDTIQHVGKKYLEDPTMKMYIEYPVQARNFPWSATPAGYTDVIFSSMEKDVNGAQRKILDIFDWKNAFETKEAAEMGKKYNPAQGAQPFMYTRAAADTFKLKDGDKVRMHYGLFPAEEGKRASFPKHEWVVDRANASSAWGQLEKDITIQIAHVQSIMQIHYDQLVTTKNARQGLLRSMVKLSKTWAGTGGCDPRACRACPLRYNCKFNNYLAYVAEKPEDPTLARTGANASKYEQLLKEDQAEVLERARTGQFTSEDTARMREFKNRQWADIKAQAVEKSKSRIRAADPYFDLSQTWQPIPDDELLTKKELRRAGRQFGKEFDYLGDSIKAKHRAAMGAFANSMEDGAQAARARIPFSILGEKVVEQGGTKTYFGRAQWMSHRFAAELTNIAHERIAEASKAFDVNLGAQSERIMRDAFTDKGLAQELYDGIANNIRELAKKEHVQLTEKVAGRMIKRYDQVFTKNLGQKVIDKLDTSVLRTMSLLHNKELKAKIAEHSPDAAARLEQTGLDETLKNIKGWRIMGELGEEVTKRLGKAETFEGIRETYRLSQQKFPVRPVMFAAMLAYIAGTMISRTQIENKVRKVVTRSQEDRDTVDDGTHASPYSVARRLTLSDFGSKVRCNSRKSTVDAEAAVGGTIWGKIRSFFTEVAGEVHAGATMASDAMAEMHYTGAPARAAKWLRSPAVMLFGGAAVGGFVLAGLLPNIKTDRQIGEETDRRKRKFKQIKHSYWNAGTDSMIREPESELRWGYSLQNSLRLGVSFATLAMKSFEIIKPALSAISEWALSMSKDIPAITAASKSLITAIKTSKPVVTRVALRMSETAASAERTVAGRFAGEAALHAKQAYREVEEVVTKTDLYEKTRNSLIRSKESVAEIRGRINRPGALRESADKSVGLVSRTYQRLRSFIWRNTTENERMLASKLSTVAPTPGLPVISREKRYPVPPETPRSLDSGAYPRGREAAGAARPAESRTSGNAEVTLERKTHSKKRWAGRDGHNTPKSVPSGRRAAATTPSDKFSQGKKVYSALEPSEYRITGSERSFNPEANYGTPASRVSPKQTAVEQHLEAPLHQRQAQVKQVLPTVGGLDKYTSDARLAELNRALWDPTRVKNKSTRYGRPSRDYERFLYSF